MEEEEERFINSYWWVQGVEPICLGWSLVVKGLSKKKTFWSAELSTKHSIQSRYTAAVPLCLLVLNLIRYGIYC